jgi:hypothetical protein
MASSTMYPEQNRDEADRSELALSMVGPKLAALAAQVMRDHPDADPVGIAAESGTIEARRCRTSYEQNSGREIDGGAVATVMPKEQLAEILDRGFPAQAREWLFAGERGKELRFVICTTNGFRVAATPIPGFPG